MKPEIIERILDARVAYMAANKGLTPCTLWVSVMDDQAIRHCPEGPTWGVIPPRQQGRPWMALGMFIKVVPGTPPILAGR